MTEPTLQAKLDSSQFEQGAEKVTASLDSVKKKAEETASTMERLTGKGGTEGGVLGNAKKKIEELSVAQRAQAAALGEIQGAAAGYSSALGVIGRVAASTGGVLLGMAAAAGAVVLALRSSILAYAETERGILRFNAVQEATGNVSAITTKELNELADALEATTMASDDAVRAAATRLATFTAASGEEFKRTLVVAQDLAAVMGTDITSAANMLGRALADPTQGMMMLRRAGIVLSESQKNVIRDLTETGRRAEATGALLDIIQKKVGGAGATEASGAAGSFKRWGDATEDLSKALGRFALDALPVISVVEGITKAVNALTDAMEATTDRNGGKSRLGGFFSFTNPAALGAFGATLGARRRAEAGPTGFDNYDAYGMLSPDQRLSLKQNVDSADALARELDQVASKRAENLRQQELLNTVIARAHLLEDESIGNLEKWKTALQQLQSQYKLLLTPLEQYTQSLDEQITVARAGPGLAGQLAQNRLAATKAALAGGKPITPEQLADVDAKTKQLFSAGGIADAAGMNANIRGMRELTEAYGKGAEAIARAQANMAAYAKSVGGVGNAQLELNQIIAQGNLALAEAAYNAEMAISDNTKLALAYDQGIEAGERMEDTIRAEQLARQNLVDVTDDLILAFQRETTARKVVESAKQAASLDQEVKYTKMLTSAVLDGEKAHQEMLARVEVMRKLGPDAFGKTAEAAERLLKAILQSNEAQAAYNIAQQTASARENIQLLQQQLQLSHLSAEDRAVEMARLRAINDLEKARIGLMTEQGQAYVAAAVKQEQLNQQLAQQQRNSEMMLEPFKNAISGIQSEFSQMFVNVFSGGVTSFKSLAASVKQIFIRMAAEIATLLVFRPVVGSVLGGLGLDGLANSLGVGGQTGGYNIGNLFGLGGSPSSSGFGGSSFGGGTSPFSSLFGGSSFGSFLSQPISQVFNPGAASGYNTGMLFPGESAMQGVSYAGSFLDSFTVGQGLGAIGGIGSGIYQLSQGGTANTIGGIASLAGAALSFIPGVGPILGPLVSMAGGLFGGLFGRKKPKIPTKKAQLYTAPFGAQTSGSGTLFQGSDFYEQTPFGLLGYYGAGTNKRFDDPNGEAGEFLSAVADMDRSLATLLDQSEIARVRQALQLKPGVAVSWKKAFDNEGFDMVKDRLSTMLTALYGDDVASQGLRGIARGNENIDKLVDRASEIIQLKNALKDFGREVTDSEKAVRDINKEFDQMAEKAERYGFSQAELDKIQAERRSKINQLSIDLETSIDDAILGFTNPLALELKRLDESFARMRREAEYLNTVSDRQIDLSKLDTQYQLERDAIYERQLGSLKDFQKQITYGGLSGASPLKTLEGTRDTFRETALKALAGNGIAMQQIQGYGTDYIQSLRSYYGSSVGFQSGLEEVQNVVAQLIEQQGTANPVVLAVNQSTVEIVRQLTLNTSQIEQINAIIASLPQQLQDLIAMFRRLVSAA